MIPARSTPPSFPERILSAILGTDPWTESIVGDLHEEYARLAAASRRLARPRADVWYCLQALALGARCAGARASARLSRADRTLPVTTPTRGDSVMRTLGLETRYALRSLWKRPGLSALVILTLALGLGANAAVFENIDALILRPFTIHDVDRVVMVAETSPQDGKTAARASRCRPRTSSTGSAQTDVFERLAAFEWWDVNLAGVDDPERISGFLVSADFFPALGVSPALGRTFTADEETRGRHRRAIIGHNLWQRRFQGDRAVIGKSDSARYRAVRGHRGRAGRLRLSDGGGNLGAAVVRRGGGSARQARYLSVVGTPRARAIGRGRPGPDGGDRAAASSISIRRPIASAARRSRRSSRACATRGWGRSCRCGRPRRRSCCSSRARTSRTCCSRAGPSGSETWRCAWPSARAAAGVIRELLLESTLLAVATIPVALAVAWASIRMLRVSMPPQIVRFVSGWQTLDVDGRLIAFTSVLALGTAIVFGILPALQASAAAPLGHAQRGRTQHDGTGGAGSGCAARSSWPRSRSRCRSSWPPASARSARTGS